MQLRRLFKYRVFKVLAENNEVKWDFVALCPGLMSDAMLPGTNGELGTLGTGNGIVWSLLDNAEVPDIRAPSKLVFSFPSLRDEADAIIQFRHLRQRWL